MAFGELVSEARATVTSTKILPFDGGEGYRTEGTAVGQWTGKLQASGIATGYREHHADGSYFQHAYIILTTPEGETIKVENAAVGVSLGEGRAIFRGVAHMRTTSAKYSWLNTTPLALESESGPDVSQVTVRIYEWK